MVDLTVFIPLTRSFSVVVGWITGMIACNTNQVLSCAKLNAHIYVLYRSTTYLQLGQDFEFVTSQRVLATASVSGHSEMSVKREEDLELLIFKPSTRL